MKLQESGEMYLETIYVLKLKTEYVKSIDVANELNFSRASVSRAMKLLEENKYIEFDDKKNISLTLEGLKIAKRTFECHNILTRFLVGIGVDEKVAEDDACKIEHDISDESLEAIEKLVKNM